MKHFFVATKFVNYWESQGNRHSARDVSLVMARAVAPHDEVNVKDYGLFFKFGISEQDKLVDFFQLTSIGDLI
jgi:hypothetical protein